MMKVTNATSRKELNEMAKGLEIKFVGVKTEALVEAINKKIDALLSGSEEVVEPAAPTGETTVTVAAEAGAEISDKTEILTQGNPEGGASEIKAEASQSEGGDKPEGDKEEAPVATRKEFKTLADFGLAEGEVVQIVGEGLTDRAKNLDGRKAVVDGISRRGFVRVILLDKEGNKQNCKCPMPATNLIKVVEEVKNEEEGAVA